MRIRITNPEDFRRLVENHKNPLNFLQKGMLKLDPIYGVYDEIDLMEKNMGVVFDNPKMLYFLDTGKDIILLPFMTRGKTSETFSFFISQNVLTPDSTYEEVILDYVYECISGYGLDVELVTDENEIKKSRRSR